MWNFNMDEAPRGSVQTVTRKIGKNETQVEEYIAEPIIAADQSGTVVTISKWLPKEARWMMFTKDAPPVAWMAWPSHPVQT